MAEKVYNCQHFKWASWKKEVGRSEKRKSYNGNSRGVCRMLLP